MLCVCACAVSVGLYVRACVIVLVCFLLFFSCSSLVVWQDPSLIDPLVLPPAPFEARDWYINQRFAIELTLGRNVASDMWLMVLEKRVRPVKLVVVKPLVMALVRSGF